MRLNTKTPKKQKPLWMIFGALMLSSMGINMAQAQVAKIESYFCERPDQRRVGTASIWRLKRNPSALIVLTSDHVLFHGKRADGFCHVIRDSAGQEFELDLMAVDFTRGLASLDFINSASSQWIDSYYDLSQLMTRVADSGRGVLIRGFPFESADQEVRYRGQVYMGASQRHVLTHLDRMVEVVGRTEFGMSGGIVELDGQVLGLISHQYLRLGGAGELPKVDEVNSDINGQSILTLLVSGSDLLAWFASKDVWLGFDPHQARVGRQSVVFENIEFSLDSCQAIDRDGSVGGSGYGVGIGGRPDVFLRERCHVKVKQVDSMGLKWPFARNQRWQELKQHFEIPRREILYTQSWDDQRHVPLWLNSKLEVFFLQWNEDRPLFGEFRGPVLDPSNLENQVAQLSQDIVLMISALGDIRSDDLGLRLMLADLTAVNRLLSLGEKSYRYVRRSTLDRILQDQQAWTQLYSNPNVDLKQVTKLRADLSQLKDLSNLLRP